MVSRMDERDRRNTIARYEARLARYGGSHEALGWGQFARQDIRFSVLAAEALQSPESSVLDVGCGFADLYDFLVERGWRGRYTGVDLVPGVLSVARERHPKLDLRELDLTAAAANVDVHDYVIACGIANAKLAHGDNLAHADSLLQAMFCRARVLAASDFLSTHVDFQHPDAFHTDPAWAFARAKELTRRVALRHDYMPFEFSLFLWHDEELSAENVFRAFSEKARGV